MVGSNEYRNTPSFSEELEASLAIVNLRIKLGMSPGAKVKDVAERALARIVELEEQASMDRLYLEASRERLVSWMLR